MNIKDKSYLFHQHHKGIMPCITWINTIYSSYVVLKAIFICILLHPNTGNPAYFITYPVRKIAFAELSTSD